MKIWLALLFTLLLVPAAWSQSTAAAAQQAPAASPAQNAAGSGDDDLAQMKTDLNTMESLLNNMSSEITFLRDQNLQILLNTNGRMWTILIRDLRQQVAREEQRRAMERSQTKERGNDRTPKK